MSENLKVNAKTSILEFKRKHNKLVDNIPETIEQAIQADKDILSQIKVEYDEDSNLTYFVFPYGVLPLSIVIDSQLLYFKGNQAVDSSGNTVADYVIEDLLFSEEDTYLAFVDELSDKSITAMSYINWNGSDTQFIGNSYYLYYPITESGTKLYEHAITLSDGSNTYHLHAVSTVVDTTNLDNLENFLSSVTTLKIIDYDTLEPLYFSSATGYITYFDSNLSPMVHLEDIVSCTGLVTPL